MATRPTTGDVVGRVTPGHPPRAPRWRACTGAETVDRDLRTGRGLLHRLHCPTTSSWSRRAPAATSAYTVVFEHTSCSVNGVPRSYRLACHPRVPPRGRLSGGSCTGTPTSRPGETELSL